VLMEGSGENDSRLNQSEIRCYCTCSLGRQWSGLMRSVFFSYLFDIQMSFHTHSILRSVHLLYDDIQTCGRERRWCSWAVL